MSDLMEQTATTTADVEFGGSLSHFYCECNEDRGFCGADLTEMTDVGMAEGASTLCMVCDDLERSSLVCECGVPFRGY